MKELVKEKLRHIADELQRSLDAIDNEDHCLLSDFEMLFVVFYNLLFRPVASHPALVGKTPRSFNCGEEKGPGGGAYPFRHPFGSLFDILFAGVHFLPRKSSA